MFGSHVFPERNADLRFQQIRNSGLKSLNDFLGRKFEAKGTKLGSNIHLFKHRKTIFRCLVKFLTL